MTTAEVLREWFAIRPAAARVCAALFDGGGKIVSHDQLGRASGQRHAGVVQSIKQLRGAMDPDSFKNVFGKGYRMTDIGLADCRRALADAAERAAA